MTAGIDVTPDGPERFRVEIRERGTRTVHVVTLREADRARLGGDVEAAVLVERSVEFLLEREPKEAILARFDLPVIGRYFPEYEDDIRRRVGA